MEYVVLFFFSILNHIPVYLLHELGPHKISSEKLFYVETIRWFPFCWSNVSLHQSFTHLTVTIRIKLVVPIEEKFPPQRVYRSRHSSARFSTTGRVQLLVSSLWNVRGIRFMTFDLLKPPPLTMDVINFFWRNNIFCELPS